jgi:hypothetical protein
MKHVKLFESFQQNGKFEVEIEIRGENPDVKYGCTSYGVGNTPREAAMFALQSACNWLRTSEEIEMNNLENFESEVEEYVSDAKELEDVLQMLEKGKIKKDSPFGYSFFSSHGDAVYADAGISKAPETAPIGGHIVDGWYEEESGEDE